jgi:hypothetical protein
VVVSLGDADTDADAAPAALGEELLHAASVAAAAPAAPAMPAARSSVRRCIGPAAPAG